MKISHMFHVVCIITLPDFCTETNASTARSLLESTIVDFATCGCQRYVFRSTSRVLVVKFVRSAGRKMTDVGSFLSPQSSPKSPFIAVNADFAASGVQTPFVIAMNAACASLSASLILISVSRTSTKTTVQFAGRTCFHPVNRRRTFHVVMLSMPIVSANSLGLTTAVPSAKRQSFLSSPWQRLGKPAPGTLPSIPCPATCSVLWTLCAMIARQRVATATGTFWEFNVPAVAPSTRSWNKC